MVNRLALASNEIISEWHTCSIEKLLNEYVWLKYTIFFMKLLLPEESLEIHHRTPHMVLV